MEEKQNTKATEKAEKKVVDKKVTTEAKKETKKQETPKDTKKKFENFKGEKMKINKDTLIGLAVVVVLIVAIVIGVLVTGNSPKKSVNKMLRDLKSGNSSQAMLSDLLTEENFDQEAQKLLFEKLEWNIQNVKEEGNKATIEIEITNKDFRTIIGNYMQKILKVAFSGKNVNEEEMTNYLIDELKNDSVQTVTVNKSMELEKKDGKWEVTDKDSLVDILLPGFKEAISAFN